MPVKFLRVFKTMVCLNQCFRVLSASLLASPGTTFAFPVPHPSIYIPWTGIAMAGGSNLMAIFLLLVCLND